MPRAEERAERQSEHQDAVEEQIEQRGRRLLGDEPLGVRIERSLFERRGPRLDVLRSAVAFVQRLLSDRVER